MICIAEDKVRLVYYNVGHLINDKNYFEQTQNNLLTKNFEQLFFGCIKKNSSNTEIIIHTKKKKTTMSIKYLMKERNKMYLVSIENIKKTVFLFFEK